MISRDTAWQQGSVITQESFSTLCPSEKGQDIHAIVISYDCDLQMKMKKLLKYVICKRRM